MFSSEWNGIIGQSWPENLDPSKISNLNEDSSEEEWLACLNDVEDFSGYIYNERDESVQLKFPSWKWTFLHHVAYFNAPISVINEMSALDFHLTLKDAEGKIALDYVHSNAPNEYRDLFKPKFKIPTVNLIKLNAIEKNFHDVIYSRAEKLVQEHNLILPNISVILESVSQVESLWFPVPGMYGGFNFYFEFNSDESDVTALISESWCRVVGGSGERHRCTADKWELIASGFV